jgi:hypothetical protein
MDRAVLRLMEDYGRCYRTGSPEHAFRASSVGGASSAMREIQEEALEILTNGFNGLGQIRWNLWWKRVRWSESEVLGSLYWVGMVRRGSGEEETVGRRCEFLKLDGFRIWIRAGSRWGSALMGKLMAGSWRFASTKRARGRTANGGTRRGNTRINSGGSGDGKLGMMAAGPAGPRWARRLGQKWERLQEKSFQNLNKVLD